MSLVRRVEALEQQVAELMARVEVLEKSCCINDIIHLEPLSDFPNNPSDGDLCVVGESGSRHLYCYLNSDWRRLDDLQLQPIPKP